MSDNDVLRRFGGVTESSLTVVTGGNVNVQDENLTINFSSTDSNYYNDADFLSFCKKNKSNFTMLSVNIQSLNAKLNDLKVLVKDLFNNNCPLSLICLQETWISDGCDTSLFKIDGYNFVSQPCICSSHAGLAFYVRNDYEFESLPIYNKSLIWEGLFIKIKNESIKKYVNIGNVYRPPRNTNFFYQKFISEIKNCLYFFGNNNQETLITGDFNINLLRVNEKRIFSEFYDTLASFSYLPLITLPTRISDTSATLIDKLFL